MKIDQNLTRKTDKPIKYKQFIQELQNSSRSSNHDISILSQMSFRENNTQRENYEKNYIGNNIKHQQVSNLSKNCNVEKNNYQLTKPENTKNQDIRNLEKKLYTFCDVKNTERSVQRVPQPKNYQKCPSIVTNKKLSQEIKYFKTAKLKYQQFSQQKQNINFVNKIISTIQNGFEGKVLKTQTQIQEKNINLQQSQQKLLFPFNEISMINSVKTANQISSNNKDSSYQPIHSIRKIQSVRKIFNVGKPSSSKKRSIANSQQNSRQSSLNNKKQKIQTVNKHREDGIQQCSSKKKVLSLNINPLKNQSINRVKLKLSLQKSNDSQNRNGFVQSQTYCNSLQRMPSLQQSKIQHLQNQNPHLLLSGTQLKQLTHIFTKQKQQKQQQNYKLCKIIEQQRQKQKRLRIQLTQLSDRLKQTVKLDQRKQLQILRKDCTRLTNSYKQIKKLYQLAGRQKEQTQSKLQSIRYENSDLKTCLDFKKQQLSKLYQQNKMLQEKVYQLEKELEKSRFNPELAGLSEMIKDKINQFQLQIQSLVLENEKLSIIREKLENYNLTLKTEIQQKDDLLWQFERQLKQTSQLKKSCREDILDHRQNQGRLTKIIKQLESKLKLTNIHNEYLTKQLHCLKNQKALSSSSGGSPMILKFSSANTLANTVTTRNSQVLQFYQNGNRFEDFNNNFHKREDIHFDTENLSL